MTIAAVLVGALLVAYNVVVGDDSSGGTGAQTAPTRTPSPGLVLGPATLLSSTPDVSATPDTTTTPGATGTPGGPTPTPGGPTPTGTPGAAVAQASRQNCALIAGTDYLSDAERNFYVANCAAQAVASSPSTTTSPSSNLSSSGPNVPFVPPPPPTPTPIPRNPRQVAFENLVGATIAESDELIGRLAGPRAVDTEWRADTANNIQDVQRLVGAASVTPPPECLVRPYQQIRSAGIELSIGAGLAASGLDANDINLMRLAIQRMATGRSSLAAALVDVSAANC